MASPTKTGSQIHEIVGRQDGYCKNCRGKTLAGSRIWWDKGSSQVWHVICPPVSSIVETVYRPPPVSVDLWKHYCKTIAELTKDGGAVKRDQELPVNAVKCSTCGMEWSGYANLDGKRHIALVNKCGGYWQKVKREEVRRVEDLHGACVPG